MVKADLFYIIGNDDKLWNLYELVDYLAKHQGQHIQLRIISEAICLENLGIFKLLDSFEFAQVDIYTDNPLQTHDRYNIIKPWSNVYFAKIPNFDVTPWHKWTGKKLFLAFYHRPTAGRLVFSSYLYNHYPELSNIHFSYESNNPDTLRFFEFDKAASYRKESVYEVGKMLPNLPLKVYNDINLFNLRVVRGFEYDDDEGTTTMYPQILVDVISETHVTGQTFYPTEKIARPMWMKKPFIVFGSRNYLLYLRQMGFKTFYEFWSEDYDGFENADRLTQLLRLIDMLANKSQSELQDMYQAMQPILEHNYQLIKSGNYSTDFTLITD